MDILTGVSYRGGVANVNPAMLHLQTLRVALCFALAPLAGDAYPQHCSKYDKASHDSVTTDGTHGVKRTFYVQFPPDLITTLPYNDSNVGRS